jgi:hypothetical protein
LLSRSRRLNVNALIAPLSNDPTISLPAVAVWNTRPSRHRPWWSRSSYTTTGDTIPVDRILRQTNHDELQVVLVDPPWQKDFGRRRYVPDLDRFQPGILFDAGDRQITK